MYSIFPIIVRKPTYPESILSLFLVCFYEIFERIFEWNRRGFERTFFALIFSSLFIHFIDFIFFQGFSDLNEDDEQKSEDNSSDSEDAIAVDKNGPKIGDLVNTSS